MRYHIDTIPVWDAVKLDGECFLCALRRKIELNETDRYLGASVMEPDVRLQVNEKGFCKHHHTMLYAQSNRLGHALMLHTHLQTTMERSEKPFFFDRFFDARRDKISKAGKRRRCPRSCEIDKRSVKSDCAEYYSRDNVSHKYSCGRERGLVKQYLRYHAECAADGKRFDIFQNKIHLSPPYPRRKDAADAPLREWQAPAERSTGS